MKHSGKTTLGRRLAARLNVEFVDLDRVTEELFDPRRRSTCREIYRKRGLAFFSELERRAAVRLAGEMADHQMVIALGGGTIENLPAMDALNESGLKVYLKDASSVLYERIMRHGLPAFLRAEDPRGSFESLYAKRTALFEKRADVVVDLAGEGVDEAFSRLIESLDR